MQELQSAIRQLKARLPRPAHKDNDRVAAPPTLVRQCRDAGVALVPCDPMGDTCPPADRLQGTPYQDMYSVLGSGATQFNVRCVPPEMVRLSQASEPKEALTVEQQERRLDERLHRALGAVERGAPNVDRLAGWTTRAPCGATAALLSGVVSIVPVVPVVLVVTVPWTLALVVGRGRWRGGVGGASCG